MRIVCPSCAAGYDVPDALLAGRKTVRCARCGTEWTPPPPAELTAPEGFPDPVRPVFVEPGAADFGMPGAADFGTAEGTAPPARPAPPLAAPRISLGLRLAWAASLLVLVAGLAAGVVWRARIAQAWPPSLRVYAVLGLAHNLR
jgi:predicted Zn finger-like uncharacterized protein